MLTELKIDGTRCVSFKHASTEDRLEATHCNEMNNVKVRCETFLMLEKDD